MSERSVNENEKPLCKKRFFCLKIAFAILLITLCVLLLWQFGVFSLIRPSPLKIVGELPASTKLLNCDMVRCGFDYSYLFEFSCLDTKLRDNLISKWKLHELKDKEDPISFVENNHPHWWIPNASSGMRKFGSHNENQEKYWSLWENTRTGQLFVEVGQW